MTLFSFAGRIAKSVGALIVLLVISAVGIFGVPLPQPLVTYQYGPYQLAAFETGLALYQTGSQTHFYSFSPLNDFYLTPDGFRSALLPIPSFEAHQFQTNLSQSPLNQRLTALKAYWNLAPLEYELDAEWDVRYQVIDQGETFDVVMSAHPPADTPVLSVASTVKLSADDLVFDETGQLYSLPILATITDFNSVFATQLRPYQDLTASESAQRYRVPSGRVLIHNPTMPGFLVITAAEGQTMWVDNPSHLLEIVQPVTENQASTYQITFNVAVSQNEPGGNQ